MKKLLTLLTWALLAALIMAYPAMAAVPTNVYITRVQQNGENLYMYVAASDSQQRSATQSYNSADYALNLGENEQFRAQQVFRYADSGWKILYVVCVDISGSITSSGSKYKGSAADGNAMKQAVKDFGAGLKSNEAMSLLAFGDAVEVLLQPTNDAGRIAAAAETLAFKDSKTQLYEAIYKGVTLAQERSGEYAYSAVIVLTDGTDEPNSNGGEEYDLKSTSDVVARAHVPVYTIAFDRGQDNLGDMADIAAFSGGIFQMRSKETLSESLCNIQPVCRDTAVAVVPLNNDEVVHQNVLGKNYTLQAMVNTNGAWMQSNDYLYGIDWSVIPTPTPEPTEAPPTETPTPTETPEPTPTPDATLERLDVDDVTEDSTQIVVRTEKNAYVAISVDGELKHEDQANDQGKATWDAAAEGVVFEKGQRITVEAKDAAGNSDDKSVVVSESRRQEISLDVQGIENGVVNAETLDVTGTAESGAQISIAWRAIGEEPSVFDTTVVNGIYNYSITADQARSGRGYLSAYYTDGYGHSKQKVYPGEINWDTEMDKGVDPTSIGPVTEDSTEIIVHTEPNSEVTVYHNGTSFAEGMVISEAGGTARIRLQEGEYLTKGEAISVRVVDSLGHEEIFENLENGTVGESSRTPITVNIENVSGKELSEAEMTVYGEAEKNADLEVLWYKKTDVDDDPVPVLRKNLKSLPNGTYSVTLPWQEGIDGEGYIQVGYKDLRGYSRFGYTQGTILWATATPEPERVTPEPQTPTPSVAVSATPRPTVPATATPDPGPTMTAAPEPTKASWPQSWIIAFQDQFGEPQEMVRNRYFWLLVAAVVLVIALIVLLIVFLIRRAKKNRDQVIEADPERERVEEFGDRAGIGTVRESADSEEPAKETQRRPQPMGSEPRPAPRPMGQGQPFKGDTGNTRRINAVSSPIPTVAPAPSVPKDVPPVRAASTGTVRLDAKNEVAPTGTVRISREEMQPKPIEMIIQETRSFAGVSNQRTANLFKEITIGRDQGCQLVIQDETVSSRHALITREGNELFFMDLQSSNGSSLNDHPLTPKVRVPLHSGDTVTVGRTTLVFRFEI